MTIADFILSRFGVATGARFDDNTINILGRAEDPLAADAYCFDGTELCYVFEPYYHPVEDVIMFDDFGVAALV